jgi:rare lipoprotein A
MRISEWIVKAMLPIFLASFCSFAQAKNARTHSTADKKIGTASYYSDKFHGRRTANGERYNKNALTAQHASLPFGTVLRVTNLKNHRSVKVRVNDRAAKRNKRLLDLSKQAAQELGMVHAGLAKVEVEILSLGNS